MRMLQRCQKWFLANKKTLVFLKELIAMVVILLILPTVDIGTDLRLAIIWWPTRRNWAIAILCTILANTSCSAVLWWYLEPRWKKKYSWIFVIFQVFPQYRAVSIIYKFVRNGDIDEDSNVYNQNIRTVEAYIESSPQVIILAASFFSASGKLTGNLDDLQEMEIVTGYKNTWANRGFFSVSYTYFLTVALSFVSTSWGVTKFYQLGPTRFIFSKGLDFLVALLGTSCFISWRITMLASMFSSTGVLIPAVFSVPPQAEVLNGQCSSVVGLETDSFRRLGGRDLEVYNPRWNCKNCGPDDRFSARCGPDGNVWYGSCFSDCDCPPCAPFCSTFGWCQVSARYGRGIKTKMECNSLRRNSTSDKCWNPPPELSQYEDYEKCSNMQNWVRYDINHFNRRNWNPNKTPFYTQRVANYSLIWDEEKKMVLYTLPETFEKCKREKKYCEDWKMEQHLFCMEPVTASLWVWSGIFLLPNIILNVGLLITTFGRKIFKIIRFPQLFFQGIFGTFLFGPESCFGGKFQVSGLWSGINFLLSSSQFCIGLLIMSRNFYWTFVFGDRSQGKNMYFIRNLSY